MKLLSVGLCIASLGLLLGCGGGSVENGTAPAAENQGSPQDVVPAAQVDEQVRHDVVYVCNCGPECSCDTVAVKPGNCTCGTELKWAHLLKIEGDEALLCTCKEGCTCAIDPADESKCACGQPIRRVSLRGTGLYFCNCGASCTCNYVSAEPGSCGCGKELKTSA